MTGQIIHKINSPDARERALEHFLGQMAGPAYDAYRADPSRGLSLEDVRASLGKR